jgi:hypothetical protein
MAKGKSGGKVGRSSVSGRFVPVDYAKKHPKTTEVEKIKRPTKK